MAKLRLAALCGVISFIRDYLLEFLEAGEREYVYEDVLFKEGFASYVAWLARGALGEIDGLVPWSVFWVVDVESNRLVGLSSLRQRLSPWLAQYGGHIGYRVRPSMRGRKIGTFILRETLRKASELGISKALVVCTLENTGSQGVLRSCGAEFESETSANGRRLLRYWVSTRPTTDMNA